MKFLKEEGLIYKLEKKYYYTILARMEMLERMTILNVPFLILKKQCRLCSEPFIIYIIKHYYQKLYYKLFRFEDA